MSTSIVIPLGHGSRHGDTELRYCLRSVEQYLTGYGEVFIIGRKPNWLKNVIHIPFDEGFAPQGHEKERNIFNKIMVACNDERVSDDFLFMNDDHFLRSPYEADKFPFYYEGRLSGKMTVTDYKHTLYNTIKAIDGMNVVYTDVHCPILYNKDRFKALAAYDWSIRFGYCIKTLYCRKQGGHFTPLPDIKIDGKYSAEQIIQVINGRPWFSIGDKAFEGDIIQVLQDLYPNKSKFE
jgi:hypothetical protein